MIDLSPNPALPPLERSLQHQLLRIADEFGEIARQLCLLVDAGTEDVHQLVPLWSDAHEAAYTRAVNDPSHGQWV